MRNAENNDNNDNNKNNKTNDSNVTFHVRPVTVFAINDNRTDLSQGARERERASERSSESTRVRVRECACASRAIADDRFSFRKRPTASLSRVVITRRTRDPARPKQRRSTRISRDAKVASSQRTRVRAEGQRGLPFRIGVVAGEETERENVQRRIFSRRRRLIDTRGCLYTESRAPRTVSATLGGPFARKFLKVQTVGRLVRFLVTPSVILVPSSVASAQSPTFSRYFLPPRFLDR